MSIYRRINDKKNDRAAFEYMIKYVSQKPYTAFKADVGVIGCRKEAVFQDMNAVKSAYHKNSGRQYDHAVLSITPDFPSLKDSDYIDIGRRVASHCVGYQCMYALHKDTKIRHLHFLWNTVSYKDGRRFSQGPPDLNREKAYINSVLEEYGLDPIRTSTSELVDKGEYDLSDGWRFLEIDNDVPEDRNLFLAPPPKTDPNNTDCCTESAYGISSSWYGGKIGGNPMDSRYFSPAAMPGTVPALSQSTVMASGAGSTDGLNLINVNNIKLGSLSDLPVASQDMGQAFRNSAVAGAEAIAALRQRGIDAGVMVATVNNYYVDPEEHDRYYFGLPGIPHKF